MKDYRYTSEDGRTMSVSDMVTQDIRDCLGQGIIITDNEGMNITVHDVARRLRLELEIRELEGRL